MSKIINMKTVLFLGFCYFLPMLAFCENVLASKEDTLLQLEKEAFQNPSDLSVSLRLGRAYYQNGNYGRALATFERILILKPESSDAKIEQAKCLLKLKQTSEAIAILREVSSGVNKANVQSEISRFLDEVRVLDQKHYFSGELSISGTYDSNVTTSGQSGVIDEQVNGGTEQESLYLGQSLNLNHIYRPALEASWEWASQVYLYNDFHDRNTRLANGEAENLDLNYISLNTGPVFYIDNLRLQLSAIGSYMRKSNRQYLNSSGLKIALATRLNEELVFFSSLSCEKRDYYDYWDYSGWYTSFDNTLSYELNDNQLISLKGGYRYNNAAVDWYEYSRFYTGVNYFHALEKGLLIKCGVDLHYNLYTASNPAYKELRKDKVIKTYLALNKKLSELLSMEVGYNYDKSLSSLETFTYSRHLVKISINYLF